MMYVCQYSFYHYQPLPLYSLIDYGKNDRGGITLNTIIGYCILVGLITAIIVGFFIALLGAWYCLKLLFIGVKVAVKMIGDWRNANED